MKSKAGYLDSITPIDLCLDLCALEMKVLSYSFSLNISGFFVFLYVLHFWAGPMLPSGPLAPLFQLVFGVPQVNLDEIYFLMKM